MRISRWLKLGLVTVFILAVLSACTSTLTNGDASSSPGTIKPASSAPDPPASLEKIRVAEVIHSVFYAPQYVALHQGFFEQEGLDVELGVAWGADKGARTVEQPQPGQKPFPSAQYALA